MSHNPEQPPEVRKQQVLESCPYLNMLINPQAGGTFEEVERMHNDLLTELRGKIRSDIEPILDSQRIFLKNFALINPQSDPSAIRGSMERLILIGFEVADMGKADLFRNEIIVLAMDSGLIKAEVGYDLITEQVLMSVVESGVNYRANPDYSPISRLPSQPSQTQPPQETVKTQKAREFYNRELQDVDMTLPGEDRDR